MDLLGSDFKLVKDNISLAYEMYQSDPDLLCIKGEYYLRIGEKNKASEVFKTAIWINPSDANMYLYQAQIMYDTKNFTEAIKICKSFKTTQYMDLEMRTLLGKCYFSTPKLHKSSQIFLGNLKIDSTYIESIKYLKMLGIIIFMFLTKDSLNVILRRDLKKICLSLGKPSQLGKFKITFKGILYFFNNLNDEYMKRC